MKVAVVGAGIVGTAVAWKLAQDGHAVNVFEGNASVAESSSFANAGLLAPSLAQSLAMPAGPGGSRMARWKLPQGLVARQRFRRADWQWRKQWQAPQAPDSFDSKMQVKHQLLLQSQECLQSLCTQWMHPPEQSAGHMVLIKTETQAQSWAGHLSALKALGYPHRLLTPDTARQLESGISATLNFHSAMYFEGDVAFNCRQLAQILKDEAQKAGAIFHFETTVQKLDSGPRMQLASAQGTEVADFDRVILCNSLEAAALLAPHGSKLPLHAVHGYSVSGHIREPLHAPRGTVLDWSSGISMVRLGSRVRVAGGFELGQPNTAQREKTLQSLYLALQTHFPGATQFQGGAQSWRGTSAFTRDGLPLVGPSAIPGIWINTGHGVQGAAMALGCAKLIADLLAQRSIGPDLAHLDPQRSFR